MDILRKSIILILKTRQLRASEDGTYGKKRDIYKFISPYYSNMQIVMIKYTQIYKRNGSYEECS